MLLRSPRRCPTTGRRGSVEYDDRRSLQQTNLSPQHACAKTRPAAPQNPSSSSSASACASSASCASLEESRRQKRAGEA